MQNALVLASILGPMYLVMGLSILLYMKAWKILLEKYEDDHYILMPSMLLFGILGVIMINAYNVWELNVWLLVTITGWGMALKSLLYFLLPGFILKKVMAIRAQAWVLYLGGALGVLMGAILTYYSYFA